MDSIGTKLLDFSQPFDVNLLDQVVASMNDPNCSSRSIANQIMVALQAHSESWKNVCDILEQSSQPMTKYFALQILEDAVKYRWNILPGDQQAGIKSYIVEKLIQMSQDEKTMAKERMFMHKLDLVLVQVLKHEWPNKWPTFISEIIASSKTGELVCENNLFILKLLSEEIFDFSKDQMTTLKAQELKESLNAEFTLVFQLCEFVLEKSQRPSLITICLQTLLRFLSWIPLGYIFETNLVGLLATKFFTSNIYRNDALACLAEIAGLQNIKDAYEPTLLDMYAAVMNHLNAIVPLGSTYEQAVDQDEVFVQRLSLFFTSFFRQHLKRLEAPIVTLGDAAHVNLMEGFTHLISISRVEDDGIFKICLEFWHGLTKELYTGTSGAEAPSTLSLGNMALNLSSQHLHPHHPQQHHQLQTTDRKLLYVNTMTQVRLVMISQMVKPSEVLIVEDENGEIVRETTKDTEALSQYKTMHEALVYLTHLDYEDTEHIMLEKLALQVDGTEWSWGYLNTLCWAIGSISGAMAEEDEKRFLVTVIKDLLGLCEVKRGKDNKAVIASNIMYVVGQYPRFLRAHWKFLKTVVNKLFEFMHELHPGVQDMACDTFLKIAQKCRKKFVTAQIGEQLPFVEDLLAQLPSIVSDLATHQIHSFYESVASMLAAETDTLRREALLAQLMDLPNQSWGAIMTTVQTQSLQCLFDPAALKELTKILRTNVNVCRSIGGPGFASQMRESFNDLMNVYSAMDSEITARLVRHGEIASRSSEVRAMRQTKREVLKLFYTFVTHSGDQADAIATTFLPSLCGPILTNYKNGNAVIRESEVLVLMTGCVDTLKERMAPYLTFILDSVFEVTLGMITRNFEDYPEHRSQFFQLLKAANDHCFTALFNIPTPQQKLVVDSIVWAFKHTDTNIQDTGLETLHTLLLNIQQSPAISQPFYAHFYLTLLQDILGVLTDRCHKSGFKMHATILKHLFSLVEARHVTVPLWTAAGETPPAALAASSDASANNSVFLKQHVSTLVAASFPNLTARQVTAFVTGCFDLSKDLNAFKNHLRDVLVTIKEFAAEDNAELYREETAAHATAAAHSLLQSRLAVPGLVQPSEVGAPDDMADL